MDQIKIVIKSHIELLIMAGCVMLVIGVFFYSSQSAGMGIFGTTGTTFSPLVEDENMNNEGTNHLQGLVSGYIPLVIYNSGAQQVNTCVAFKNLLSIKLENGTTVSGNTENGFALYLSDIKTKEGNSVMEVMSANDIAQLEEVPAPFVYDKENDLLYIFASGTYHVIVKIYTDSGASQSYEFQLPVETN